MLDWIGERNGEMEMDCIGGVEDGERWEQEGAGVDICVRSALDCEQL